MTHLSSMFVCTASLALAIPAYCADWPMWGASPARNMVNTVEKGIPADWDIETGRNIRWVVPLGSQSYGNPVISNGKVYVGTNNEGTRDTAITGDKGVVMCFSEKDGEFLWQAVFDKLEAGRVNDWPLQGICSTPWVEGNRVWFVNNRCEVVCVDTEGFRDGKNDGMQDEQYKGIDKADIIWSYDLMEELGVFPHNLATSSPLIVGDLILLVTGNGVDEGHLNLPSPTAPSFVALNKNTGELVWEFVVQDRVLHGQWSSPAYAVIEGRAQAVFPGGDGWVYSLNPQTGELLWKFNCNPPGSVWELGGYGTKNNLIATPVIHGDSVYIGVGQDPEHGTGIGNLYRIQATGTGDVTNTHKVWHYGNKDFGRTLSTVAIHDGLLYVAELEGYLHCLEAETGKLVWKHDVKSAVWGSTMIVDGKLFLGDEDGDILIMKAGREKKVLNEIAMDSSVYTTPSPANGTLFITTKSKLYAIEQKLP